MVPVACMPAKDELVELVWRRICNTRQYKNMQVYRTSFKLLSTVLLLNRLFAKASCYANIKKWAICESLYADCEVHSRWTDIPLGWRLDEMQNALLKWFFRKKILRLLQVDSCLFQCSLVNFLLKNLTWSWNTRQSYQSVPLAVRRRIASSAAEGVQIFPFSSSYHPFSTFSALKLFSSTYCRGCIVLWLYIKLI